MHSSQTHSSPSSYALEKAVRVATRRLGSGASELDIEAEAVRILANEGFSLHRESTSAISSRISSQMSSQFASSHGTSPPAAAFIDPVESSVATELHLSISAAPCASRRLNTQRARLYDRIRSILTQVPRDGNQQVFVHVRETSSLAVGHPPDALLSTAETLVSILEDMPVSYVHGPFIDAALPENTGQLERIPELMKMSARLCPTIQIATSDNGLNEHALEAACLGLAVAAKDGEGTHPVILSTQDCDRRAFGHRVHPEAVVAYHRQPTTGHDSHSSAAIPEAWQRVGSADLPLLTHHVPQRTTDHVARLGPGATPDAVLSLVADGLLAGVAGGARRQMMILC